jgi:hypothetical protein
VPLGIRGSFLPHRSGEGLPRQLGRDGVVVQMVKRILKIVGDFPTILNYSLENL